MKKRIIVACGGTEDTSTMAANNIIDLCKEEGIKVEIVQCRASEIESNCDNVDLIVTTARVTRDFGVPLESGIAFVSGVGIRAAGERILKHLK